MAYWCTGSAFFQIPQSYLFKSNRDRTWHYLVQDSRWWDCYRMTACQRIAYMVLQDDNRTQWHDIEKKQSIEQVWLLTTNADNLVPGYKWYPTRLVIVFVDCLFVAYSVLNWSGSCCWALIRIPDKSLIWLIVHHSKIHYLWHTIIHL